MAYSIINALLLKNELDLSAAEAHGIATGLLCVNPHIQNSDWFLELLPEGGSFSDDDLSLLSRLFEETRRLLASEDYDFDLFLPDDDQPLTEQLSALKNWSMGFLYGVGSLYTNRQWSPISREIMQDVTEFTRLDAKCEGGDEEETAFVEITEYLRSAVLLLRDELIAP